MRSVLCVTLVGALVAVCSAHLLLINPKQRGSLTGLDKAGSNDGLLLSGPCGGRQMESPVAMWKSSDNYTVIFQKNLDHWASATPGHFTVTLIKDPAQQQLLHKVLDTGEASLHLYDVTDVLPAGLPAGNYILQVKYVTMNPNAPAVFYQCADIAVA